MSTDVMTNTKRTSSRMKVKTIAQIGMLSAIATVLMLFEIPLPFAPSFYQLDFSEVPVLVGCFAMGPLAGAAVELIKILMNLIINGTITGGVGEAANFIIGCSLCVPAGAFEKRSHVWNGAWYCADDSVGMSDQCICSSAALFETHGASDRCACRYGDKSKSGNYQPQYTCNFRGSAV